jgi:hypothetical protein
MTRRHEIVLGLAVFVWVFVVPGVAWLAYSSLHGFDPSLCRHYGGCWWTA